MSTNQTTVKLILLNGASSSGKTSIAKALQHAFEEPYLHVKADDFLYMLPPRYFGIVSSEDDPAHEGFACVQEVDAGTKVIKTNAGPLGHKTIYGMHRAIAELARSGLNLIIDDVIQYKEWLMDYLIVLKEFEVFFVKVFCSSEELTRRESVRADRDPGLAMGHFNSVYSGNTYDITVDTSVNDPHHCAGLIKDIVQNGGKPWAFTILFDTYMAAEVS